MAGRRVRAAEAAAACTFPACPQPSTGLRSIPQSHAVPKLCVPEGVARPRLQTVHGDLHRLPNLHSLPGAQRLARDERPVLQLPEVAVRQLRENGVSHMEAVRSGRPETGGRCWSGMCAVRSQEQAQQQQA